MATRKNSIGQSIGFGFLTWLVPPLVGLATTPLIVRGFGVQDYGLYVLMLAVLGYSFNFNVARAATKYIAEYLSTGQTERVGQILSATLALGSGVALAGAIVIWTAARWIAAEILCVAPDAVETTTNGLYLAAIVIAINLLASVFWATLQAAGRFDRFSQISVATNIVLAAGTVVTVRGGGTLSAVLWWHVAVYAVNCVVSYVLMRRAVPEAKINRFGWHSLRLVAVYSASIVLYQLAGNATLLIERGWLARAFGASGLAYYTVPTNLAIMIHALVAGLTLVLFPLTSDLTAERNTIKLLTLYRRATKYTCIAVVFIAATMIAASSAFLTVWLGREFAEASAAIMILQIVYYSIMAIMIVAWQTVEGHGLPRYNAGLSLLLAVITIPLIWPLSYVFGLAGAAVARVLGVLIVPVYILVVERRVFGGVLYSFWRDIAGKLIIAGGMCFWFEHLVLMYLPNTWGALVCSAAAGAFVYAAIVRATNLLTVEERRWCGDWMKKAIAGV